MITSCPHCNHRYQVPDDSIDALVQCRACKKSFFVENVRKEQGPYNLSHHEDSKNKPSRYGSPHKRTTLHRIGKVFDGICRKGNFGCLLNGFIFILAALIVGVVALVQCLTDSGPLCFICESPATHQSNEVFKIMRSIKFRDERGKQVGKDSTDIYDRRIWLCDRCTISKGFNPLKYREEYCERRGAFSAGTKGKAHIWAIGLLSIGLIMIFTAFILNRL